MFYRVRMDDSCELCGAYGSFGAGFLGGPVAGVSNGWASWLGTPENSVGEWVAVSGTTAGISGMRSSAGKAQETEGMLAIAHFWGEKSNRNLDR